MTKIVKGLFIISIVIFFACILIIQLLSLNTDKMEFYEAPYNIYNSEDFVQADEKAYFYKELYKYLNFKYSNFYTDLLSKNGTKKFGDNLMLLNPKEYISTMNKIDNIKISVLRADGEHPVKIYSDSAKKGFYILNDGSNYQFYINDKEKPKKYLDLINKIESETPLFYKSAAFGEYDKLIFRNAEMDLILNNDMPAIIYSYSYPDLSFECENLPFEIIYTIKNSVIEKTEIAFINIGSKSTADYKTDKNLFFGDNADKLYEVFNTSLINKKSIEKNGIKCDFKDVFNIDNNYNCGFLTLTE